jgi:hypothetical protein
MKLSIQHFQRTWKPDAPDAAERLERFSRRAGGADRHTQRIAGEFSDFAQLPPAPIRWTWPQVAEPP